MFEYFIYNYGMELIGLLLAAILGCLGKAIGNIYREHVNDDTKRAIARACAAFVEQAWKTLHGVDKLQKALETAQELLAKKGIDFDADEMMVYIEAAVAEFNEAFRKPVEDVNAAGTYRVPEDVPGCSEDIVVAGFGGN